MAEEGLKYTISAKDKTAGTLRSSLGTIARYSSKATRLMTAPFRAVTSLSGMGLQANVNLLKSAGREIDRFVERGTRVALVGKAFASMSGHTGAAAKRAARELQNASHGALTLAKSMEIANRALSGGLSLSDIKTSIEFASKKALTTGQGMGVSINKMIVGLSRGSTLFLDDFGLLTDGIEGVRREYERIAGIGAFNSLGPAAQKAEMQRQAIAEMNQQMQRIGVTGNELAFQWLRIKTSVADAVDRMAMMGVKNEKLRGVLGDVADIVGGIANALGGKDQAEGFATLAEGVKKILAAAIGDIGKLLFKPLKETAKGFVKFLWSGFKDLGTFLGKLLEAGVDKFIAKLRLALNELPVIGGFMSDADKKAAKITGMKRMPGLGSLTDLAAKDFLKTDDEAPFAATARATRELADKVRGKGLGSDKIEKENAVIRKRRLRAERVADERELRRLRRKMDLVTTRPRYMEDVFSAEGKRKAEQERREKPDLWARMSSKEQRERAKSHQAEARGNWIKEKGEEIESLDKKQADLAKATAKAEADAAKKTADQEKANEEKRVAAERKRIARAENVKKVRAGLKVAGGEIAHAAKMGWAYFDLGKARYAEAHPTAEPGEEIAPTRTRKARGPYDSIGGDDRDKAGRARGWGRWLSRASGLAWDSAGRARVAGHAKKANAALSLGELFAESRRDSKDVGRAFGPGAEWAHRTATKVGVIAALGTISSIAAPAWLGGTAARTATTASRSGGIAQSVGIELGGGAARDAVGAWTDVDPKLVRSAKTGFQFGNIAGHWALPIAMMKYGNLRGSALGVTAAAAGVAGGVFGDYFAGDAVGAFAEGMGMIRPQSSAIGAGGMPVASAGKERTLNRAADDIGQGADLLATSADRFEDAARRNDAAVRELAAIVAVI